MPTYQQALEKSLQYFGNDELAAKVFIDKYALRDKSQEEILELTPDDMHWRIAKELARVESRKFKRPYSEREIYNAIANFGYIIPQGGPMYGIGNTNQYTTLSNCYVLDSPLDSYGGIHYTDQQLTQIAKRRGGNGLDISQLRPAEAPTTNSSRTSSGIISFVERYSNSIREVGQNGRRGALMITCSIHHPQILDFIRCKADKTKITGANISVRLTDEFLQALEKGEDYEIRWPVEGQPKISKRISAKLVWDEIIEHAWQSAEPGLLFWDNIIRESPADCYAAYGFKTIATNPCSELPLSALDSCRPLLLNLFKFVIHPFTSSAHFAFGQFYKFAQIAQRLMDDIVDLEIECIDRIIKKIQNDPEPQYIKATELEMWIRVKENCKKGRRTGTGITALGDTLAALGIKYGSEESIAMTDKIYRTLKFGCYRSSIDIAKELGPFPIFNSELEKDCTFLNRIKEEDIEVGTTVVDSIRTSAHLWGEELYEDMQKYGRRNIALLTTAPAGTVSIEAEVCHPIHGTTSGIEPGFLLEYTRKKKVNPNDEDVRVDSIDQNGDSWQHFIVHHPALRYWMQITGETDITKSPWYGCCAEDIDWEQRVRLQATAQRHVDHGISSTINLPEDVSKEAVDRIYIRLWKEKCKGGTVYRKNCRNGVLVDEQEGVVKIHRTNAVKRPKNLHCNVHQVTAKGKKYVLLVGYLNGDENEPYEVFVLHNNGKEENLVPVRLKRGTIRKLKRGNYQLCHYNEDEVVLDNVADYCTDEEEALARIVSTSLRHGVDIKYIVHQLEKVKGDMTSFAKAISRTLKKYIPDGSCVTGETCQNCQCENIVRQEGCVLCLNCGWSKCS